MTNEHNNAAPTDWRELCRRLYVELWHCNKQMTGGPRPRWTQGSTVRDVLRDASLALEATPAAAPAPASTQDEPFGHFRADPFGWTDCAADDEGAIALYERPAAHAVPQGWYIAVTGSDEVVVRAPSDGPGAMTIPSGSDGTLPVRLLDALCRALISAAPSQPAVPQGYALISVDALQAWGKLDEVKAACVYPTTAAAPSQPVACGLCQGSGVLSPTQKCICQYGGKEPVTLTDELDMLDVKVSAGLCQVTADGKHAYLREIQAIIAALREKESQP